MRRTLLSLVLIASAGLVAKPASAQGREGKPDRFLAIATDDAVVYRKRDGKLAPVGRISQFEKVIVIREYKNGAIWAIANKRIKGFVKGSKFEKKMNIDEQKRKRNAEAGAALSEVWEDDTEAEDLLVNQSGLRWGLNTGYDKVIGLGFGVPVFYGFAREGRRVELGGELYYYPFNAGRPLQLVGVARYMINFSWYEIGPEFFGGMTQLLALDNSRGYQYGVGLVNGLRFTNSFQFNVGARVNFNGGVSQFYYASLLFTM